MRMANKIAKTNIKEKQKIFEIHTKRKKRKCNKNKF